MDYDLQDKAALVSGSTQGIGYAVARALAVEGARVTLNGRGREGVRSAVSRLREEVPGASVTGIAADVAQAGQVAELLEQIGQVDVLVNNAGLFEVAPFDAVPDEQWLHCLEVNVLSGVRLTRALLPGMIERGWGRVVFVSSESGVDVPADMVHYGVCKAAVLALANGLAKSTRGAGVTVNSVLGGPTYSDGVAAAVEAIAADQDVPVDALKAAIMAKRRSLLERFIEPQEIANLVVYLASTASSATNGAALRADGGVLPTVL